MLGSASSLQGFTFEELQTPAGLARLDSLFLAYLQQQEPAAHHTLIAGRQGVTLAPEALSEWLVKTAPVLERFIAWLFSIELSVEQLRASALAHDPIFQFKKHFVLRQARRRLAEVDQFAPFTELHAALVSALEASAFWDPEDLELSLAQYACALLAAETPAVTELELVEQWCTRALHDPAAADKVATWVSFHIPAKLDYQALVPLMEASAGTLQGLPKHYRHRDGFALTDERMSSRQVLDEANYCVYCHEQDGDFCSKGFPVKKTERHLGLKRNALDDILTGCPLDEKISEMHWLKKNGYSIAPLAVIMVDNPMCPATGHRICNDCMKACIYQKQEPVNIPQIETRCLTDVLSLPYGVEIYDLLTKWNPLRSEQWLAKPYNGKKVLVMGMGPAGFTLAHHLLMEGCAVVGMEGLKIEPLAAEYLQAPIRDYQQLVERLDERVMAGFGGVAEYGITVRWDKNFLKLIYVTLMRRPYFQVFGSVRFGGTLTVEDAWTLGFDHLAVAVGAGLPRELPVENSLAPGMRQANDFLMALQLTGAAKASSLANLQVRLPAVVIGGGLTGIDTATEVQAYYLTQIEKVQHRYQRLCEHQGEVAVRAAFDAASLTILDEFLDHAQQLTAERQAALREGREPDLLGLLRRFGGVTVTYRRRLQESPAYRRNHEEVTKAFEEGIYYAEGLEPEAVVLDAAGFCQALRCKNTGDAGGTRVLPAKSIFVATGAKPNIAYEFEHRGTFAKAEQNYQRFNPRGDSLEPAAAVAHCKEPQFGALTSYQEGSYRVSFLGDTHPVFHGSVVKAVASAKRVYPAIMQTLQPVCDIANQEEYAVFRQQMQGLFEARVVSVTRLSEQVLELVVHAPMATHNFHPGQFYRIQNYETGARRVEDTLLQTEAMALLGAKTTEHPGQLSFLVLERGASSRLVATFKPGQPLAVMGPTGVKTKLPQEAETWLVIGGTMALAELRALAPVLHERGCRLVYAVCSDHEKALLERAEIERHADVVLWVVGPHMTPPTITRPQDMVWVGELSEALCQYAASQPLVPLTEVQRVLVVGSPTLLRKVQAARQEEWQGLFGESAKFFGSVYGAMQCMLKGVCAQCLQWQIDPSTGKRTKAVYACSWQEQPIEQIDIHNLDERLEQNRAVEILTQLWLDYLFSKYDIVRV